MKEYTVPGPAGEITLQLSDEDAKARGLKMSVPPAAPKAKVPANKQASPQHKAAAQKADG